MPVAGCCYIKYMTGNPEHLIGEVALAFVGGVLLWRIFEWFVQGPTSPDPWDQETEKALHEPEAVEVCHRCFDPVMRGAWFCKHCGCAVGPYNNLMPYLNVFSEGEILRNGINNKLRHDKLFVAGYLLFSLNLYVVFAPIYWVFLFRNLKQVDDRQQSGE